VNRILIAAPGPAASFLLEKTLRASGYSTEVVRERAAATTLVRNEPFDLFMLELALPAEGWDATLRELRKADPGLPVMVLTSHIDDETVAAVQGEADEWVIKPFGIDELLTRVRARLRKRRAAQRKFLRAGEIAFDLESRRVEIKGQPVELTSRELSLLETLMRHPDEVVSRERLLSGAWGYDYDPGSNVVAVYVGYLRRKVDVPYGRRAIQTVRGVGYRLAPDGG
jgi:DNA-binding response OmpR family regulator